MAQFDLVTKKSASPMIKFQIITLLFHLELINLLAPAAKPTIIGKVEVAKYFSVILAVSLCKPQRTNVF